MAKFLTIFILVAISFSAMAQQKFWLFAGTYTGTGSKGIYVLQFDVTNGTIEEVSTIAAENPSYLTISNNGKNLYSVSELGQPTSGEVSAFSFDKKNGVLTYLNKKSTLGDHPCYVAIDSKNKWVVSANYSGGNFTFQGVRKNGSLNDIFQTIQQQGTGPVKARQEKSHLHSAIFSPNEKYIVSVNLGTDEIAAYTFNGNKKPPTNGQPEFIIKTAAGAGPRHIAFHPQLPLLYILEELTGTVAVYEFKKDGKLIQTIASDTISALPDKGSADIHFSPDGKFLYTSNRGLANNISIYQVNEQGTLQNLGYQSVEGKGPRNFTIDPTGNYLLVANQQTNNIVVFNRNASSGLLTYTGYQYAIPKPVCLQIMK